MDGTGYTAGNIKLPPSWLPVPEWDTNHKTTYYLRQQGCCGKKSIGFQWVTPNPAHQKTLKHRNSSNYRNRKLKFTVINYGDNIVCFCTALKHKYRLHLSNSVMLIWVICTIPTDAFPTRCKLMCIWACYMLQLRGFVGRIKKSFFRLRYIFFSFMALFNPISKH